MSRAGQAVCIVVGTAVTAGLAFSVFDEASDAVGALVVLLVGPTWALAFCLASSESDFPDASRSRAAWLHVLPWTFLLAPLVIPNVVLLASFFRDARADGGRSWLTWDRMRPGEQGRDHHWPS